MQAKAPRIVFIDRLESRRLLAASFAVLDKAISVSTTARNSQGLVRVNNTYELRNQNAANTNNMHGLLISGGKSTDLKPLAGNTFAFASDVSETGVAVGISGSDVATKWVRGTASNLGAGRPMGISNDGRFIVGAHPVSGGTEHAFSFSSAKDLGTLGGSTSRANDVNNDGIVVGQSSLGGGGTAPFYYDGTMHRIGGGTEGEAFAINDKGVVVGRLSSQAFMFNIETQTLTMLNLVDGSQVGGTVRGSGALDINNAGQMVGFTSDNSFNPVATYWENATSPALVKSLVTSSFASFGFAKTINDKGQVFAVATKPTTFEARSVLILPYHAAVSASGTLNITGTIANDVVSVALSGTKVKTTFNGATTTFSKSAIKRISISLGGGDDTVTLGTGLRVANISAGSGKDTLNIRNGVSDIVNGGANSDKATADAGDSLALVESVSLP